MDARRVRSFVVFVTFLFGLAACCSGGNRKIAEAFVSNAAPLNLDEIDEDTAEQVWIHCRTEWRETTKGVEDFDSHFSREKPDSNSNTVESEVTWLARRKVQQAIGNLPPHIKQTLLDCVRNKNFPAHDYVEEAESSRWLIKYRELFSNLSSLSRRYLLRKNLDEADEVRRPFTATIRAAAAAAPGPAPKPPAKAPGPTPKSPAKAPAPSKSGPTSSPSPTSKSPSKAPPPPPSTPPPAPPPPRTPPAAPPPPAAPLPPALPVVLPPARPRDSTLSPPSNSSTNKNLVIAMIAVGCVAGLLLIALILVCLFKGNNKKEKDPKDGQRDEKPLFNLGSSNTSPGSSQLANGIGRRSSRKSFRTPSVRSNLSIKSNVYKSSLPESQLQESSTVASVGGDGNVGSALPPPPGRVAAPPPAAAAPAAPPPPPPKPPGPRPPPPPKGSRLPNPKSGNAAKPTPPAPGHHPGSSLADGDPNNDPDAPKTKLKPFFWDKVLANPDHSMVWHELRGGSFQVDEEMIESLFGVSAAERNKIERKKDPAAFEPPNQYIQIIDPKKAQNLAILLKALNVTTEEVCDAIKEGHELPPELVQTLLKMAPTTDEELKLRLFTGDLTQLGPAERFLKVLVEIPYAFKRLESLLFMSYLQEEVTSLKESFATLEVACKELTKSRLFLKLLEAVLKTGNRMNDGTFRGGAQAFKLDTLLKLADVKGTDGKTTLLHFVVQEIIRSEGIRAARKAKEDPTVESLPDDATEEEAAEYYRCLGLKVVSGLSSEIVNVRKAALIDGDVLTSTVSKLGHSLAKSREFLNGEMKTVEEETKFRETLTSFVQNADVDVMWLLEEEKRMMAQVRSTADYFHGQAGKDEGLRLFVIVRDFLIILDKVCREVKSSAMAAAAQTPMKNASLSVSPSSGESHRRSESNAHKKLFPTIKEQEETEDFTSSDDESPQA